MPRLGSLIALSLAFALAPLPAMAMQASPDAAGRTAPALQPAPAGMNYLVDTATAPALSQVQAWQGAGSPYDAIGVYIPVNTGMDSRYDKVQSNLNASWVGSVISGGWHVLPIYVGPQYACSGYQVRMSSNVATAQQQGIAAGHDAAASAYALGIPMSSPVMYDLESTSHHTKNCTAAAQAFLAGWTLGLHQVGRNSGVYGSRATTMTDIVAAWQADAGWAAPDVLWTATDSGTPATSGYNPPPDGTWVGRRANQFNLGVDRSYGGTASMDIDESVVDDTFWTLPSPDQTPPRIVAPAPPHVTKSGTQTLRWQAADASGVAYYQYQLRHAVPGRSFQRWSALSKRTKLTSKRVSLRPGEQWCVRVIVIDRAGNKTAPQVRCVARLSDDRSLRAGRGWSRVGGRYLGTSTLARRGGAVLRGGSVSGNYVVVMTHGPGAVVIAIGRHKIGTVHGNGVHVLRLPTALAGKLSMRTTSRKKIAIDGYAVTVA